MSVTEVDDHQPVLDLGIADTAVLLPWEHDAGCERLLPGVADAVFGVEAPRADRPVASRPLLGVMLSPVEGGGIRVDRVSPGSIAASADVRAGDVLISIGGTLVKAAEDRGIFSRGHAFAAGGDEGDREGEGNGSEQAGFHRRRVAFLR